MESGKTCTASKDGVLGPALVGCCISGYHCIETVYSFLISCSSSPVCTPLFCSPLIGAHIYAQVSATAATIEWFSLNGPMSLDLPSRTTPHQEIFPLTRSQFLLKRSILLNRKSPVSKLSSSTLTTTMSTQDGPLYLGFDLSTQQLKGGVM